MSDSPFAGCVTDADGTYCTAHACGARGQHCFREGCPHCVSERASASAEFGLTFEPDTTEDYIQRLIHHAGEDAQLAEFNEQESKRLAEE